ncbi:MAG: hypothetical protein OXD31_16840 [Chloroflexi bacterium]|nr:hypothetical protein [Chloroflexota bacterium]
MSKKRDEIGDPHFRGATPEALARALLRPINRPSGQGQAEAEEEEEVSFMRKLSKPGKKRKKKQCSGNRSV